MKQKVKLSTYSILVSTFGMAILIAVIVFELKQNHETAAYFGASGFVFLCVMALIYAPLSISVNDEKLNIPDISAYAHARFLDLLKREINKLK